MSEETYGLRDALLGGPGLDGYAFQADVYCVNDGQDIARQIFAIDFPNGCDWSTFTNSEQVPQPIFFGESDFPEYCAKCGERLPTEIIDRTGAEDV